MRPEARIPTSGSDGKLDLGDSYLDGGGGSLLRFPGRKDLDSSDGDHDCGSSIGCPGLRKLDLDHTVFAPHGSLEMRSVELDGETSTYHSPGGAADFDSWACSHRFPHVAELRPGKILAEAAEIASER